MIQNAARWLRLDPSASRFRRFKEFFYELTPSLAAAEDASS